MIKVYQIQLTRAEEFAVNRDGWDSTPKAKAYINRSFSRTFDPSTFQYYTHVANVDVDDMEAAFEAMNLWQESKYFRQIKRLSPCSSMSVGDILEKDGEFYRCASFGFDKVSIL